MNERKKRVVVVGGGASGIMAALWAAKGGAKVTVLEQNSKPLKKLLMTGNGRCNLTNLNWEGDVFRTDDPVRLRTVLSAFDLNETLAFFHELGIVTKDRDGWVYPQNDSAAAVARLLLYAAEKAGITIKTNQRILEIGKEDVTGEFAVRTDSWAYPADCVIVAAGSPAGIRAEEEKTSKTPQKARKKEPSQKEPNASLSGRETLTELSARRFCLESAPLLPALTSLKSPEAARAKWAGVRTEAVIQLIVSGRQKSEDARKTGVQQNSEKIRISDDTYQVDDTRILSCSILAEAAGELQLTENGVSGIPVFQVSRYASEALSRRQEVWLQIDFLPKTEAEEAAREIRAQMTRDPEKPLKLILLGLLPEKLAEFFSRNPDFSDRAETNGKGIREQKNCRYSGTQPERIAAALKCFRIRISGTGDLSASQVCMGGVLLSGLTDRLEAPSAPGLYFAGEAVNVDGTCGGYNLQWAWSSGKVAGCAAAAE